MSIFRKCLRIVPALVLLCVTCVCAYAGTADEHGYETADDQYNCTFCGDVNADGDIDAADSRLVLRACVSLEHFTEEEELAADVDGDCKITSFDARLLLRYSVGLEKAFRHRCLETVVFEEPTCFDIGTCADLCVHCGKLYNFGKLPKTAHIGAGWDVLEPATCQREGLSEQRCIFCNTVMDTKLTEKKEHRFGEVLYETAPSCTRYVNTYRECLDCHYKTGFTAEAPAGKHAYQWVTLNEGPVLCTDDVIRQQVCTHCGETGETERIPGGEHANAEWRTVQHATCTSDGLQTKTCRVCKAVYDMRTIPGGHKQKDGSYKVTAVPTCTIAGSAEYYCTVCGQTVTESVDAKGHAVKEGTEVISGATCTTDGTRTFVCADCSETVEQIIPASGHVAGNWQVTDEDGGYYTDEDGVYYQVKICVICSEELDRKPIGT